MASGREGPSPLGASSAILGAVFRRLRALVVRRLFFKARVSLAYWRQGKAEMRSLLLKSQLLLLSG